MSVQWFPGHMAKTRRLIEAELKLVDVVIELVDARIPESSRNPMLDQMLKNRKPRLLLLNKEDLADPNRTAEWLRHYSEEKKQPAIAVNANAGRKKTMALINDAVLELTAAKRQRYLDKGARHATIRAMIVGIPNVGKSTLINSMIGRSLAETGNKPGVTRGKQWLRLSDDVELMDMPGMLWPKFEDEAVGYRLAMTGAVSDDVFVWEEACFRLVQHLQKYYPKALEARYALSLEEIATLEPYELMQRIGRHRGALVRGNQVDDLKTARLIIKDFRAGALGRISLE